MNAATINPDTGVRWHRRGFALYWSWKSRPQRRNPAFSHGLVATMCFRRCSHNYAA
jgi:hypothetical protein